MSPTFQVHAVEIVSDHTIPGRIAEHGLVELLEALGGQHDPGSDVWASLRATMQPMTLEQLGEKLLDMVLLQPPIPAGCSALLERMRDPEDPPWADHDVMADRFWLWYAHHIVHKALPETFPEPAIRRVALDATMLDPDIRPPGKRATPRERTRFVARLLADRPGDNPLSKPYGDAMDEEWAFDVVFHAVIEGRSKPDAEALEAMGADPGLVGRLFTVRVVTWLDPQWMGGLAQGQRWTAGAVHG